MTSRMTVPGLGRAGRIAGSAALGPRGAPIRPPTRTGPPSWRPTTGTPTGAGCAAPTGPAPGGRLRLTAAPEKSGNGKKTPVPITTRAGTPSPMTPWTYGTHGSVADDATGRRLYTPGGHAPGHHVELRYCTGKAHQRWTAPRN
ncbi:hypothetical protein [Streptomyces sp. NPDC058107]|uniref:hypothetical protein n=2 Tax=Streptomyces TaxID=1883 RepID=UPI0036EF2715